MMATAAARLLLLEVLPLIVAGLASSVSWRSHDNTAAARPSRRGGGGRDRKAEQAADNR